MKKIFLMGLLTITFFVGCATTQLQTKAIMTRTVVLNPLVKKERYIYLDVKNTASSKINLAAILKKKLLNKGLLVVSNPTIADYIMNINVLFADNIKEAYAIKAGAATGINAGLIAGVASSSVKNGLLVGAVAAIAGGIVANATEDSIYRAVIDVSIKERKDGAKKVTNNFDDDFSEHRTRILVSAVKMNLKLENAIPILQDKASEQISRIF